MMKTSKRTRKPDAKPLQIKIDDLKRIVVDEWWPLILKKYPKNLPYSLYGRMTPLRIYSNASKKYVIFGFMCTVTTYLPTGYEDPTRLLGPTWIGIEISKRDGRWHLGCEKEFDKYVDEYLDDREAHGQDHMVDWKRIAFKTNDRIALDEVDSSGISGYTLLPLDSNLLESKVKKTYTKKQITEAIAYWQKLLTESSIDKTDLENDLYGAAIDNVEPEMPEEVEDVCREIVYNFVYNHSEQMLMKFADGYKDKDYIKNIEGEMSTLEAYDSLFALYEHSDATSLYTACNGDIRSLQSSVNIVGASIEEDDYDMKMVEVEFKYQGKTYKGSDVWYSGNKANDDMDEFEHCSKSDLEEVIYWVQEDKDIAELPADVLNCIKGKYIKATALLDILEMALPCGDSDGAEYVKIV